MEIFFRNFKQEIKAMAEKKKSHAGKGAAIGAGLGAAETVREIRVAEKNLKKGKVTKQIKGMMAKGGRDASFIANKVLKPIKGGGYKLRGSFKKTMAAVGIAGTAGLGAVIGKMIKMKKKGMKKSALFLMPGQKQMMDDMIKRNKAAKAAKEAKDKAAAEKAKVTGGGGGLGVAPKVQIKSGGPELISPSASKKVGTTKQGGNQ